MTTVAQPRTAAQMNKRLHEIGAELAKGRFVPVANARQLEAEEAALKREYAAQLERDAEDARDAAEVAARVTKARKALKEKEREARIDKSVEEAMR